MGRLRVESGDPETCNIYGDLGLAAHLGEAWYPKTKEESREKQADRLKQNSGFPGVWDGYAWNYNTTSVDYYMGQYHQHRDRVIWPSNFKKKQFTDPTSGP